MIPVVTDHITKDEISDSSTMNYESLNI